MKEILTLTNRNVKLYFRDKASVFYSIFGGLILILLFVFFLGEMHISQFKQGFIDNGLDIPKYVEEVIFCWTFGGILVLNSISVPQIMLHRFTYDREDNFISDFYVTPLNRRNLVISYVLSAIITGTIITYISFIVGQIYLVSIGGNWYSLLTQLKVILLIILSTTSFSSITFSIYTMVKSKNAVGALTGITSSLGGFLGGMYVPVGALGGAMKNIVSLNPIAHATTLFRNILMTDYLNFTFREAPKEALVGFLNEMGLNLYFNNTLISLQTMIISLLMFTVTFILISYLKLKNDKF